MSKRKFDMPPSITKAQFKAFSDFAAYLASDTPLSTVLEQMEETSQPDSHPATAYKDPSEVAEILNISYTTAPSHALRLKDSELQNTQKLSRYMELAVQDLLYSPYYPSRALEARTRTIMDLIILDRLKKLQDQDAATRLRISPEVSISTNGTTSLGGLIIRGIADWTLNYGNPRSGTTLVVVEAKRAGDATTGLPQMLIYMAGIHQQRHERINQSVFGILADSMVFIFAFLDHKKKFYKSEVLDWEFRKSDILAYIDTLLLDAIESSPHTTPTKKENAVLYNYQKYLGQRWVFGEKAVKKDNVAEEAIGEEIVAEEAIGEEIVAEEAIGEEIVAEEAIGEVVDVDEKGMVVGRKKADEKPSSEIPKAE